MLVVVVTTAAAFAWYQTRPQSPAIVATPNAPYGGNVEGVGTAALIYFDKPASALSLPEALALAVIPQNLVARNPATARGYAAMMAARSRLFDAWRVSVGADGETVAMFDLPLAVRAPAELPYRAPHFSRAFLAQRREAGAWTSSLDLAKQQLLEQQLTSYIARQANKGLTNAAAILVDHRTMAIRALVGSADFFNDRIAGQVDGTRAKRSPGSALKPFIYGLALEQGLIHPMTLLKDAPKRYGLYTPENFDRGFFGSVMAKDALIYSRAVSVPILGYGLSRALHGPAEGLPRVCRGYRPPAETSQLMRIMYIMLN